MNIVQIKVESQAVLGYLGFENWQKMQIEKDCLFPLSCIEKKINLITPNESLHFEHLRYWI